MHLLTRSGLARRSGLSIGRNRSGRSKPQGEGDYLSHFKPPMEDVIRRYLWWPDHDGEAEAKLIHVLVSDFQGSENITRARSNSAVPSRAPL